jgi:hypothetical protein
MKGKYGNKRRLDVLPLPHARRLNGTAGSETESQHHCLSGKDFLLQNVEGP